MPHHSRIRTLAFALAAASAAILLLTRPLTAVEFQKLPLDHTPSTMAVSEDGKTLFIAHESEDLVSVAEVTSGKVLATIATKRPIALLSRGDQLMVANNQEGKISVFAAKKNWELTDEVEADFKEFVNLTAPLGKFYKGFVLATCVQSQNVTNLSIIDILRDKHINTGWFLVGSGVATVSGDGKRFFYQNFPNRGNGITKARDFDSAIAGKVVESSQDAGGDESRWLLYQVRPGPIWFGSQKLCNGMPPASFGDYLGYLVVPDRATNVCYGLTDQAITCYALDQANSKLGERPCSFPAEYVRFKHRELNPDKRVQNNKAENDEYSMIDRFQVAVTLDKQLHLYLLARSQNAIYRATTDAFDVSKAPPPTEPIVAGAANPVPASDKLPAQVHVGEAVKLQLSGGAGTSWELASGPKGAQVAANGALTWTPSKADIGERQFKIKVKTGDQISFLRLTTEVLAAGNLAASDPAASKTGPSAGKTDSGKTDSGKTDKGATNADTGGVWNLQNVDASLGYSLDGKSLLLIDGNRLTILDSSGLSVVKTHEFEARYRQMSERAGYYVGLAAKSIDLIDKKTFDVKKSIAVDYSQLVSMTINPKKPVTYVAVAKPAEKDMYASKPVLEVDETGGQLAVLPNVYGQWLAVNPEGTRLFCGLHDMYKSGEVFDPNFSGVRNTYTHVDNVVAYDLSDKSPKRLAANENPGANGKRMRLALDGKHVSYLAGGGSGGYGYAIAGLAPDDVTRESTRYQIEAYPVDIAFHPSLNLVACTNGNQLWMFDRKTGEKQEDRFVINHPFSEIASLWFSPNGTHLMALYKDAKVGAVLEAIELKLKEKEQTEAAKAFKLMASGPATGPGSPATSGSTPAVGGAKTEPAAVSRTWHDKSGKFQIEATLLGVESGKAVLQKASGEQLKVPTDIFSDEDQTILRTAKPYKSK